MEKFLAALQHPDNIANNPIALFKIAVIYFGTCFKGCCCCAELVFSSRTSTVRYCLPAVSLNNELLTLRVQRRQRDKTKALANVIRNEAFYSDSGNSSIRLNFSRGTSTLQRVLLCYPLISDAIRGRAFIVIPFMAKNTIFCFKLIFINPQRTIPFVATIGPSC